MNTYVDLRSDTVTKPSEPMRAAMAAAEVGDDVFGEDSTVNRLQDRAAEIMGKEAALFVASGTMANLIAFLTQTRPGDSVILSKESHPYQYEAANLAAFGGLLTRAVEDPFGMISPEQVEENIVEIDDPHFSHTTLITIENTTNRGGGMFYTPDQVAAIGAIAHNHGMKLHCDGARIFNAAIAAQCTPLDFARHCDSICFCLSKGLGCPAGSLLCGTRAMIHEALRYRKMLGGGMRQIGILAAAGLYALDHHIATLQEDHRRAAVFRHELTRIGIQFSRPSPTNILFFHANDAYALTSQLADEGVLVLPHARGEIRAVFHRDIDDNALDRAIAAFRKIYR